MLVTTLLVVIVTSYLFVSDRHTKELADIRSEGANFTRILSNIPYQQFVPRNSSSGVLELIRANLANSSLSYVAIVDSAGNLVNKIAKPETILPVATSIDKQSMWMSEHEFEDTQNGARTLEYRAPLLDSGSLAGHLRIGYVLPELNLAGQQFSFLATMALPICLLMVLFYFLFKRAVVPLQQAQTHIGELISAQQNQDSSMTEQAELSGFVQNFNYFLNLTQNKVLELEAENVKEKTANNLLIYHKRQVEAVLHTMLDAVIVIDESGQATFANKKLEAIIGISPEAVIGKKVQDWSDNEEVSTLLSRYQGNVTPLNRRETLTYTPADSPEKSISVSVFPLISEKNATLMGTLVMFRDVSREVQLLKSRDEFISHVSHELKSPLNVMLLHTELLSSFEESQSQQSIECINVIEDEIERLTILINDLLKITQFESDNIVIDRQRIKLQEFLEDTFNSAVRGSEARNIKTQISIAKNLSTLNIDKELFRIALNNLLSNAIKYSNPGDTVTLEADEIDDHIQIQVSDTGIGIAEAEESRIFEKFYRSEREESSSRPGHGLGLALAREIVNLHKGELSMTSKLGEGTVFTIRILKTSTLLREAS